MKPLTQRFGRNPAYVGCVRVTQAGDADEQQHFARGRRERRECVLDAALKLTGGDSLEGRGLFEAERPDGEQAYRRRVLEYSRTVEADMQVPGDRKQPRGEPGIRSQTSRVFHEPQPRFLKQILGNVPTSRQPHQKGEKTRVERRVHVVEGVGVALAKPRDQCEFGFPVHCSHNARRTAS